MYQSGCLYVPNLTLYWESCQSLITVLFILVPVLAFSKKHVLVRYMFTKSTISAVQKFYIPNWTFQKDLFMQKFGIHLDCSRISPLVRHVVASVQCMCMIDRISSWKLYFYVGSVYMTSVLNCREWREKQSWNSAAECCCKYCVAAYVYGRSGQRSQGQGCGRNDSAWSSTHDV